MIIGDKVRLKNVPAKQFLVAKIVTTRYGKAARLVDFSNNYVGQFHLSTIERVA